MYLGANPVANAAFSNDEAVFFIAILVYLSRSRLLANVDDVRSHCAERTSPNVLRNNRARKNVALVSLRGYSSNSFLNSERNMLLPAGAGLRRAVVRDGIEDEIAPKTSLRFLQYPSAARSAHARRKLFE